MVLLFAMKKLLTTTEACKELHISRMTLFRWAKLGKIKRYRPEGIRHNLWETPNIIRYRPHA